MMLPTLTHRPPLPAWASSPVLSTKPPTSAPATSSSASSPIATIGARPPPPLVILNAVKTPRICFCRCLSLGTPTPTACHSERSEEPPHLLLSLLVSGHAHPHRLSF